MSQIKVIYVNAAGFDQEHSESADSIKMLSFSTANYTLTDTHLGNLIGGSDIGSTEHNHDGIYFRESEFINSSAGAGDAGKPIKTDAGGKIGGSFIDQTDIDHGSISGLGDDDHTQYILVAGTRAFTGDQSFGGNKATNVANPVSGTDAVNLQTLQAHDQAMKPKTAVRAATTVAGTLATDFADGEIIDGVTLATGDRILIKDQADASENGIYVVQASGAPVRAIDFDLAAEIPGAYTAIQEGSAQAGQAWVQTGVFAVLGTDDINFVFFNSATAYTASLGITLVGNDFRLDSSAAGAGLSLTSGVLDVNVDGASIEINSDTLRVKADGINDTHIDWGTGANQVSGVDVPLADAGNYFTTDNVEAALQQLAANAGGLPEFTVDTGDVTAGDLVFISADDTVAPYATLSSSQLVAGIAMSSEVATDPVKVAFSGKIVPGILTGATFGTQYYWDGSAATATMPSTSGANVWKLGVAVNATDLLAEVTHIKKNA